MKKFLLLLVILFSVQLHAQSAFVRQNVTTSVYYRIDSVFLMAQTGDTIYIPGGSFSIGNLIIDKKLTIYGVGHYPDSTLATFATTLSGNITFLTAASFGSISGCYITGGISFGSSPSNESVSYYSITRCCVASITMGSYYYGIGSASYITLGENMIRGEVRGCDAQFVLIENNLIQGAVSFFNSNLMVKNNTFIGGQGCASYFITEVYNSTFENNIFMNNGACYNSTIASVGSCIFVNNVFNANYTFPVGSSIGSGNYVNVSYANFFVNESNMVIEYTDNFHLQTPSAYLGNDATQVGIYGGNRPYKEGAVPIEPHVRYKNISNQTDPAGNINVNISVGAQQQ